MEEGLRQGTRLCEARGTRVISYVKENCEWMLKVVELDPRNGGKRLYWIRNSMRKFLQMWES